MEIRQSFILLPCHSLEDFPVYHTGDDASSILANWTALWNPFLLDCCNKQPRWERTDEPPEDVSHSIVLVPTISKDQLPTGFSQRVADGDSIAITDKTSRSEINQQILDALGRNELRDRLHSEIGKDFFALGYVYLQVQLMARMLRYTSYLDDVQFEKVLLDAAHAFANNDDNTARTELSKCFDLLCEERNRFYPMDSFFLDLTLVAPTTTGSGLRHELSADAPINLLMTGLTLDHIENSQPETFEQLTQLDVKKANIVSGQFDEWPTQLLSLESLFHSIQVTNEKIQQLPAFAQQRPIFARRRFGLGNRLPGILASFDFAGAIHATFDEGHFPEGSHPHINWQGIDAESILAVGRNPIAADVSDAFLNLGVTIGEALDSAHTASTVFVHWPEKTIDWFEDLKRSCKYADVLGTLVTFDDYFSKIEDPGFHEEFSADQYSTPYLKQAVIRRHADPISRWIRYWETESKLDSINACLGLANILKQRNLDVEKTPPSRIENGMCVNDEQQSQRMDQQWLLESQKEATTRLTESMTSGGNTPAILVLNPLPFPRRMLVDLGESLKSAKLAANDPIYAVDSGKHLAVVDVPSCGFVELHDENSGKKTRAKNRSQIGLAEPGILRNEFFELQIDPGTGGIKAITRYDQRGNLFSQQLSMRCRSTRQSRGGGFTYARMIGEASKVIDCNDVTATIQSSGKIVLEGDQPQPKVLANFEQFLTVIRGVRVIDCVVKLDPVELPKNDPWNSYFCVRFAWSAESATVYRSVNGSRNAVPENRFESPQFIEIDDAENQVSVLTNGLPYHRRIGYRQLDTILLTAGESAREFRFGIGINARNVAHEAAAFSAPRLTSPVNVKGSETKSAFLFHFDNRAMIVTDWALLTDDAGTTIGAKLRILETQDKSGKVTLTAPFAIRQARSVDFAGQVICDFDVNDGFAMIEYAANAFLQVELYWQ